MKRIGIFIILLGIGLIIFTTFTSFTKEKLVDIENTKINKNIPQKFRWYPMLGIGIIGIGALVLHKSP
jgi:hypothetical protein